jgi:hypothetical protein
MSAAEQQENELQAAATADQEARGVRRVANVVAVIAEAFAAWNILAWYLSRVAASYTRAALANIAASAHRREIFTAALFVLFFCFATYSLSRSPRRVALPVTQRFLRSTLWALAGIAICFVVEALALALLLRGVHLQ